MVRDKWLMGGRRSFLITLQHINEKLNYINFSYYSLSWIFSGADENVLAKASRLNLNFPQTDCGEIMFRNNCLKFTIIVFTVIYSAAIAFTRPPFFIAQLIAWHLASPWKPARSQSIASPAPEVSLLSFSFSPCLLKHDPSCALTISVQLTTLITCVFVWTCEKSLLQQPCLIMLFYA